MLKLSAIESIILNMYKLLVKFCKLIFLQQNPKPLAVTDTNPEKARNKKNKNMLVCCQILC